MQVPLFSKEAIQRGSVPSEGLVRFRGMVQDVFSPEFFVPVLRGRGSDGSERLWSTKYRSLAPNEAIAAHAEESAAMESSQSVYCVPIPGETEWSRSATMEGPAPSVVPPGDASPLRPSRKRQMSERMEDGNEEGHEGDEGNVGAAGGRRDIASVAMDDDQGEPRSRGPKAARWGDSAAESQSSASQSASSLVDASFPVPGEQEMPCLLRLYDIETDCPVKVGDVIEAVGVFTATAALGDYWDGPPPSSSGEAGGADTGAAEDPVAAAWAALWRDDPARAAHNPPPSLVPRVHALVWRRLGRGFPLVQPAPSHEARAFGWQPLPSTLAEGMDSFPKVQARIAGEEGNVAAETVQSLMHQEGGSLEPLRAEVVRFLSNLAGGDSLVGELLLLHLLGRVLDRQGLQPMGPFPLAISGFPDCPQSPAPAPPAAAAALERAHAAVREARERARQRWEHGGHETGGQAASQAAAAQAEEEAAIPTAPDPSEWARPTVPLEEGASRAGRTMWQGLASLLPRCISLPLTLDNLNGFAFAPVKDHETDRIRAGLLQLGTGSQVVVDETVLSEGHLGQRGQHNLRVLHEIISNATLLYQLPFTQPLEMPVDLSVLVLASSKPILSGACLVPLEEEAKRRLRETQPSAPGVGVGGASHDFLRRARRYVSAVRQLPHSMPDALRERIEHDLVQLRQTVEPTPSADDLQRLLNMARLVSASAGASELTAAAWEHAMALEEQRRTRLGARRVSSGKSAPTTERSPGAGSP